MPFWTIGVVFWSCDISVKNGKPIWPNWPGDNYCYLFANNHITFLLLVAGLNSAHDNMWETLKASCNVMLDVKKDVKPNFCFDNKKAG